MSLQTLDAEDINLDNYSIIPMNKQAKFLKNFFPNDLKIIYKVIEKFKTNPKVIFFNSPDFDEYINIVIHGKNDWIIELSNEFINLYKCKTDHICETKSKKKL